MTEVVEAEVVAEPEPLLRARISVYETARKGGLHIAFRFEGMAQDGHVVLRPAVVKLLAKMAPGFPALGDPVEALRQARDELEAGGG